jgi:outer membrane protein OmpA-like peptidoglycan-associated protein
LIGHGPRILAAVLRRILLCLTVLVPAFACVTGARAQEVRGLDSQLFLPTASEGVAFTLDRTSAPRHLTFVAGLSASYALRSLERADSNGSEVAIVRHLAQADALFSLGLFQLLELSVAMPVVLGKVSDSVFEDAPSYAWHLAPGDPRIAAKFTLIQGNLGLAARVVGAFSLGASDHQLGSRGWSIMPAILASYDAGRVQVGAEIGYRFRRGTSVAGLELDDEIQTTVGANVLVVEGLYAVAQLVSRIGLGGDSLGVGENPVEGTLGVRVRASDSVSFDIGGGTGVVAGYGAPVARAFAGFRYASQDTPCEAGFEDYDGFEDGDFCADPDNDADGIVDIADVCPNDAEDLDDFFDDDGCPDADNDADGILDGADACPMLTEDRDGIQDDDGCPDLDDDEDGIADGLDACRMEPEDRDGFQDDDGCPEPGPRAATVTVTDTRILISERIYFEFDRDTIRSVSMPLLDQVAEVIASIDARKRIRIEGYTDDRGIADYNLDLSYRRARSVVEYLVSRGVARSRVDYAGYGPAHPVAPNDSPEGRALNRRVEFTILDATAPAASAPRRRSSRSQ